MLTVKGESAANANPLLYIKETLVSMSDEIMRLIKGTVQESWSFDLHCLLVWLTHLTSPKQQKPNKALQWGLGWLAVRFQKPAIWGRSLTKLGILLVKNLQERQAEYQKLFSISSLVWKHVRSWSWQGEVIKRENWAVIQTDLSDLGLLGWFTFALMQPKWHVWQLNNTVCVSRVGTLPVGNLTADTDRPWNWAAVQMSQYEQLMQPLGV